MCSALWVGAAFLFVVTSVAEQVHPDIDEFTKVRLAMVRFPWYYGTGITLLAIGFLATIGAGLNRRPKVAATLLLLAALVLLAIDYQFLYRGMVDVLMIPGDEPPGSRFASLHTWSERLNGLGFVLSTAAAIVLCTAREKTL